MNRVDPQEQILTPSQRQQFLDRVQELGGDILAAEQIVLTEQAQSIVEALEKQIANRSIT